MTKTRFVTLLCATGLALTQALPASAQTASGNIKGPNGADLGTLTVTSAPRGVLLHIEAKGLPPGWHAIHFHEKGDCSDLKFANAGGHVHGATASVHGLLNPAATDGGDLSNIYVSPDGTAMVEIYSGLATFKAVDARPSLMDADGSAIVIHANPDDYVTQPIGGAGPRIACAVIK